MWMTGWGVGVTGCVNNWLGCVGDWGCGWKSGPGCGDDWLGWVGDWGWWTTGWGDWGVWTTGWAVGMTGWGVWMEERAVKTARVCVVYSDSRGPGTDQTVALRSQSPPSVCPVC